MSEKNEQQTAYDNMDVEATMEHLVKKFGSKKDVESQIAAKTQELDGYLTRYGAIQLIAREKGVPIEWKPKPLDTSEMQRIPLRAVTLDRKNEVVEVAVVITRASEPKSSTKGRSFVYFTLDDGDTARDIIVFGQTQYGMFAAHVGKRVIIRPLKIGEYEGHAQLRVAKETEVIPWEPTDAEAISSVGSLMQQVAVDEKISIESIQTREDLPEKVKQAWIESLRETGQLDEPPPTTAPEEGGT